jgi:hypothetical protein
MTKLQIRWPLERPVDDDILTRIAAAHGIYGIQKITVAPSGDAIMVEYDATRMLSPAEVETTLGMQGIPIERIYS